jgi:hypothetical protein
VPTLGYEEIEEGAEPRYVTQIRMHQQVEQAGHWRLQFRLQRPDPHRQHGESVARLTLRVTTKSYYFGRAKYRAGVVPKVRRNTAMKALVLS